jgi:glycosyltransferase involved in cell wall biosynthesis
MRTLHVEMGRHRLGGTMQVFYLLRGLKQRGVGAALVCPEGSPLQRLAKAEGIEVFAVPYGGDLDLRFVFRLWRIVRRERPDVIHIHSRRGADTLGLVGAWLASRRRVIVSRRVDNPLPRSLITRLRYAILPDHVVAVSKGIRRVLLDAGIPPGRVSQVYSAVEASAYQSPLPPEAARRRLGLDPGVEVIVVVAQLIRRKGHRFLLDALPTLLARHPQLQVLFVGDGELCDALAADVAGRGLGHAVHLLGYREDVADILRAADMLVHPATMEGFANVAMQAMAAGVPVVSSAVGGMPESVRDGENGLLVPPADPVALTTAIGRLLDDPALRERLGARGREIVETELTVDAMVQGNLAVYERVLAA